MINHPVRREFEYEVQFESEAMRSKMETCVTLYMIEKSYCIETRKITLVFNLIFSPRKPLRDSEPFTACYLPGSDPEFFVKPQAGELLPYDSDGTLITVGFKPRMYSKKYKATLAIQ
ncbi:Cilia- and flagella-associated protein 47, partial [Galemys pyrenaicus]